MKVKQKSPKENESNVSSVRMSKMRMASLTIFFGRKLPVFPYSFLKSSHFIDVLHSFFVGIFISP